MDQLKESVVGVGVMSGTSLDGIDVAIVHFEPACSSLRVLHYAEHEFPPSLRTRVLAAISSSVPASEWCRLNVDLASAFSSAVSSSLVSSGSPCPLFVACHGQTLWHSPGATLQLGDGPSLLHGLPLGVRFAVTNFRTADVAAGGQGAPLVPFFDQFAYGEEKEGLALLNIGGIANVTLLTPGLPPLGFDTGPGNVVADTLCSTLFAQPCDRDGQFSGRGTVLAAVLARMRELAGPFLALQKGPRSTGRELFGAGFAKTILEEFGGSCDGHSLVATAVEFTAETLWGAIESSGRKVGKLVVGGGGGRNPTLMKRLAEMSGLPCVRQEEHPSSRVAGLTGDNKEAVAFALLGMASLLGMPANLPSVTGAAFPVVLGQISCRPGPALFATTTKENKSESDRRDVHATARVGFEANVDAYVRGRPEYPLSAVRPEVEALPEGAEVADLASGTGKLTSALLACGLGRVLAIEPAAAMRKAFSARFPGLRVEEGTAEAMPCQDGSIDAVFVGQAFHWFATVGALREIHRVLRPGGRLVLIWNLEDEAVPWVASLRALYERYDGGIPQFRLGLWRRVWETAEAKSLFRVVAERQEQHVPRASRQQCWDRIVSKSYISALDEKEQNKLREQCERVLDGVFAGVAPNGTVEYPQKTTVFTAEKI